MTTTAIPFDASNVPLPAKPDGRRRRGARTRDRILLACRALIVSGTLRPTAVQVGKEVRCSTRSVFDHFQSHDALLAEALDEPTRRAVLTLILRDSLFPASQADQDRLIRAAVYGRC